MPGYGLTELCLLLQAQGNVVAPVPLWATLVLGALPLAQFGSPELQARWLPGVVAGDVMLTAALNGVAMGVHGVPPVTATAVGDGWVLNGTELAVPQAHLAAAHRRAGPHRRWRDRPRCWSTRTARACRSSAR